MRPPSHWQLTTGRLQHLSSAKRTWWAPGFTRAGYLVEIQSFDVDIDMAFAAKGLPNDQCQATHVGYVVRGKVTLHMADGTDEVYEGGDVYVLEAGHTSTVTAGTEFITITRIEDAMAQADVVRANMMKYAAEHGIEAQR